MPKLAISKTLEKIVSEVEQSENDSADTKLFFDATSLTKNYSKELDTLKLEIEKLNNQFSVTPEGKLARKMRKLSCKIKDDQELQIFKLPTKLVHEVSSGFSYQKIRIFFNLRT